MSLVMLVVLLLWYLARAVTIFTFTIGALLLLRMLLNWLQVNPFGKAMILLRRVTEPFMRPFRFGFDNRMLRFDFLPIVAAAFVIINGLFFAWVIGDTAWLLGQFASPRGATLGLLLAVPVWVALVVFMAAVYARFLLPILGIGYSARLFRYAFQITEPLLKPLRKYLVFGMLDLSPLVLLFVVQFIGITLRNWLVVW
ncbi:MAG: YggT family protein [Acidobacteria bacterium]|nr:YggT family protein [Acidobacteriota bacterium]